MTGMQSAPVRRATSTTRQAAPATPSCAGTDPRIAAQVHAALGDARTVVNVGAGAGSYEPADRYVAAVEPAAAMRRQRAPHLAPAIDATAERLPFDDDSFDAAMATVTVHQWPDLDRGLRELRRVARGPVVVLTFDTDALAGFWLRDYVPEVIAVERRRFPAIARIAAGWAATSTATVPLPHDCADGFSEAYYARPEALLDPAVRRAQSGWMLTDADAVRAAWSGCARRWNPAPGTHGTGTCARSRRTTAPCA